MVQFLFESSILIFIYLSTAEGFKWNTGVLSWAAHIISFSLLFKKIMILVGKWESHCLFPRVLRRATDRSHHFCGVLLTQMSSPFPLIYCSYFLLSSSPPLLFLIYMELGWVFIVLVCKNQYACCVLQSSVTEWQHHWCWCGWDFPSIGLQKSMCMLCTTILRYRMATPLVLVSLLETKRVSSWLWALGTFFRVTTRS